MRWVTSGILATLCILMTAVSDIRAAAPSPEPRVIQFTPQGTVKNVRQVTVRFSEPMVPLGDPRLADPFEIACPEAGTARWADSSNWVFDFGRDLPAGIHCTFRIVPGLRSLTGPYGYHPG